MSNLVRAIQKENAEDGSKNNQYDLVNGGEPIARYMKTVGYRVIAYRIDPNSKDDAPELLDFLLSTSNDDFAVGKWGQHYKEPSYWRFSYRNDVVELYSEAELHIFKMRNKKFLDNGLLKEYDGTVDGTVFEVQPLEVIEEEVRDTSVEFGRR